MRVAALLWEWGEKGEAGVLNEKILELNVYLFNKAYHFFLFSEIKMYVYLVGFCRFVFNWTCYVVVK